MNKAQMKMGENIAILFIFFLLLVFGMIFYMRTSKVSFARMQEEKFQQQAIEVSQRVIFLPELQCSNDNVIVDSCIDLIKAEYFSEFVQDNIIYYYDLFGFSKIQLFEIYPEEKNFTLYDKPPAVETQKSSLFIPLTIFDATTSKSNFGYLHVEVFK